MASRVERAGVARAEAPARGGARIRPTDAVVGTIVAGGAFALIAGVVVRLSGGDLRADPAGILAAYAAVLPTTLPRAIAVALVVALDVAAGAVIARALVGRAIATPADAVLAGFAGAVLLDTLLMDLLGGVGLERGPVVLAVLGGVLAAGVVRYGGGRAARRGGISRWPRPRLSRRDVPWAVLIALVWAGPILLALASPVVPFADVLANHAAPAQHLLAFGGMSSLATDPAPIYGASRLFQGEIALLGTLTVATGVDAAAVMAAFAIPLVVLSAVAMWRLASAAFGRDAGRWALLAFPLAFTFVRLPDARDSVTALPLVAFAISTFVRSPSARRLAQPLPGRPDWLLAVALLAAVLVHPLVGAFAVATVVLLALAAPAREIPRVVPALAAVCVGSLAQVATMLGADLPTWTGALAILAGCAAAALTARALAARPSRPGPPGAAGRQPLDAAAGRTLPLSARGRHWLVAAALAVGLVVALAIALVTGVAATVWANLHLGFALLFVLAAAAALGVAPTRRGGRRVLLAGVAVGLGALTAAALVPGSSLGAQSVRYEVPKAVGYWLPWVAVAPAAGVLAAVTRARIPLPARALAVAAFVGLAVLPLGAAVPNTMQAEHPAADALAFDLHTAQVGAWAGYPDARRLVDPDEAAVLDEIRALESSGAWRPDDTVLHVAASFQRWRSIPVPELTGAIETMVAADAAPGIFTTGPDLVPLSAFDARLAQRPAFVLLEPAGLSTSAAVRIEAAGYRRVFANDVAILYRRP